MPGEPNEAKKADGTASQQKDPKSKVAAPDDPEKKEKDVIPLDEEDIIILKSYVGLLLHPMHDGTVTALVLV